MLATNVEPKHGSKFPQHDFQERKLPTLVNAFLQTPLMNVPPASEIMTLENFLSWGIDVLKKNGVNENLRQLLDLRNES